MEADLLATNSKVIGMTIFQRILMWIGGLGLFGAFLLAIIFVVFGAMQLGDLP